jgi:hypothetical protein
MSSANLDYIKLNKRLASQIVIMILLICYKYKQIVKKKATKSGFLKFKI